MKDQGVEQNGTLRALLPAVVLSGAAGLLSEALWLRLLTPVMGSGTTAVCVVLSGFMLGLASGGWLLGRRADFLAVPARLYALLEAAAGLWCIASPFAVRAWDSPWAALLLLPPAFATGGALPLLARAAGGAAGATVSRLYFWNTLGGALGAAAAAWSVEAVGVAGSMAAAGLMSLLSAGLAWRAPAGDAQAGQAPDSSRPTVALSPAAWFLFALCGAATLTHEALWTRLLALVLGSTAQAFAVVLAAFLGGLAFGGPLARRLTRWEPDPAVAVGWLQIAAGLTAMLSLAAFPVLPRLMVRVYGGGYSPSLVALAQAAAALMVLGVPAACLGAALPLASHAVRGRTGKAVGSLYAVSTLAAATGPWVAGFLLVPQLGLVGAVAASAAFNLALGLWGFTLTSEGLRRRLSLSAAAFAAAAWLFLPRPGAAVLHSGVPVYAAHMLKAKTAPQRWRTVGDYQLLYEEDGREASVTVWGSEAGHHALVINGKADASDNADMGTQVLLGHLPVLAGEPRGRARALVIGLGSGVTAASVARHPFKEVVVSEIEPAVAHASALFSHVNRDVLHDPRVRLELGDARALLRGEKRGFDLIVSEPSNPWIAGMSHLFSAEFLTLVRARLSPGGVFCQWLPPYQMTPEALAAALETVRRSFPHVTVWNLHSDIILVASEGPQHPDFERLWEAMGRPGVARDLEAVGLLSPSDILALRVMGSGGLAALGARSGARPHSDDRPRLEFLAPLALADIEASADNEAALERHAEALDGAATGLDGKERWLTRSLIAARRPDAAARSLSAVSESDPWRRGLERDLAELFLRARRGAEAVALLEARSELSPKDPDAWLYLARARLEAGQTEGGVKALESYAALDDGGRRLDAALAAAKKDKTPAKAFLAAALALARRGQGEAAAAAFQSVLKNDPSVLGVGEGGHVLQ